MDPLEDIAMVHTQRDLSSGYGDHHVDVVRRRTSAVHTVDSNLSALPKTDGGYRAWLFLTGCFLVEALIWGFPFSFGIFQTYYQTHKPFSEEPSGITAIGTSAMGIMYLGAPFVSTILVRYPGSRRLFQICGVVLMILTLIASSFATKVWHLIITQGILYGVGGNMIYFPTIVYLDEWFVNRRGFALGVMWAGTGVGGIVIPFIMDWGLKRYALKTILQAWAVVLAVLATPVLFFVKERIPISHTSSHNAYLSFGFVTDTAFLILQAGNVAESVGFFIPNIYLPTYASNLELSSLQGTLLVALFNVASVFGAVVLGSLCDRFRVTSIIGVSSLGASIAVFFIWGLATSLPLLCSFSLVYGFFAGGYSSTWSGISREVKRNDDRAQMGIVLGVLAFGRGIGSVISGPLSEALVNGRPWYGQAIKGYGLGYGPLIVFTGVSAILSGTGWLGRKLGWV